jgi:phosphonate transport system substrate-binding protein
MKLKKLLFAIPVLTVSMAVSAQDVVRISGIPDENPTELQRKYQPMVDYLEKKLGKKVVYVPVIDYGAVVSALSAGKIDFAWLGGFTHGPAPSRSSCVTSTVNSPVCLLPIPPRASTSRKT